MTENSDILKSLPSERLSSFRRMEEAGLQDLLDCYFWNLSLTEALYPSLSVLEVTLRNHIHAAALVHIGEGWFELSSGILQPVETQKISEAKQTVLKNRKDLNTGRIIAELSFGFWTSLFKSRYEQVLWPKLTKEVFPYAPKREQYRKTLSERLERIRHLRNRAFHHEPVWQGIRFNNRQYSLEELHREIRELIQWMSPEMEVHLSKIDRFSKVYSKS